MDLSSQKNHSVEPTTNTMEKLAILTADILDILFDGRNKAYGAYELRKTYHTRIVYALAGMAFICLLFIGGSILASAKKNSGNDIIFNTVELENYKKEEPKAEIPKPQPKPEQKIQTIQHVVPKIVKDEEVKPEEEIKEKDMLEESKIANFTQDGVKDETIMAAPVEKETGAAKAPTLESETDKIFTIVQIPAEFNGGPEAWHKYLERNLNSALPVDNGAPSASYTVIVSFIVDKTGAISDVKAENDPGYGTREEAIRVIKKGPNWKPAIQNGRAVTYRSKQKITFMVSSD
jgi:protein TonB